MNEQASERKPDPSNQSETSEQMALSTEQDRPEATSDKLVNTVKPPARRPLFRN